MNQQNKTSSVPLNPTPQRTQNVLYINLQNKIIILSSKYNALCTCMDNIKSHVKNERKKCGQCNEKKVKLEERKKSRRQKSAILRR